MAYEWLDAYCLAKKGTTKDFQVEWDAHRFFVADKMFGLQSASKEGRPYISLKADPVISYQWRIDFEEVVPGYHLNKTHWNTVYLDGTLPEEILKGMIDMSYDLVVRKMSQKKQATLL